MLVRTKFFNKYCFGNSKIVKNEFKHIPCRTGLCSLTIWQLRSWFICFALFSTTKLFGPAVKLKMVSGHLSTACVLEVDLPPSGFIRSARIWEYRWPVLQNWQKIILVTNCNNWMTRPNSSHHDNNDDASFSNLSAADSGNTSADWLTKHWVADVVSISKFWSITYSLKNNTCNRQQQSATQLTTINKNTLRKESSEKQIFAWWRKKFRIALGPLCESSSPFFGALSQQGLHPIRLA